MKKINYYFTISLVIFITFFSFFNMFQIVQLSSTVLTIVIDNLLPSLLPFMILISLCMSLGIVQLFSYLIQYLFLPLFHLSPTMSSIYFLTFFCGYPTNIKIIKEAYLLKHISLSQLQHLLSIGSFASLSFIFVSLKIDHAFLLYVCHILPSIFLALCYRQKQTFQTLKQSFEIINTPKVSFVSALKQSLLSSCYTFIFILGYMLVFQFIGYALSFLIKDPFILSFIQGLLEFSSGALQLSSLDPSPIVYAAICFLLSFGSISVMMQMDNLLEGIPYSWKTYFFARVYHGIFSFILCLILFDSFLF
ncbi:hypothetical protein [Tannockella kyphosi]|uniref:hypothetical protein n=1 Tax=Tannockella kyphosi TaxID=2899121 RepID=UPI0020120E7B|nr:hypothetical protein [Tannockella kyphosi]